MTTAPTRISLSSPGDIVAAVPYLLGFQPHNSLVAITLAGGRVGLTMRIDLDAAGEVMAEAIVRRLASEGADAVLLIVFDAPFDVREKLEPIVTALDGAPWPLRDLLLVRDGRWWSLTCEDPDCCPVEGTPLAALSHEAEFVHAGLSFAGSREEVDAALDYVPDPGMACYFEAVEQAIGYPLEAWRQSIDRGQVLRPEDALDGRTRAQLIVSLQDVQVRDTVIGMCCRAPQDALATLLELAPHAPTRNAAQLMAVLAWTAYVVGDGALASIALDRAQMAEPQHALARLLRTALDGGVRPEQVQEIGQQL